MTVEELCWKFSKWIEDNDKFFYPICMFVARCMTTIGVFRGEDSWGWDQDPMVDGAITVALILQLPAAEARERIAEEYAKNCLIPLCLLPEDYRYWVKHPNGNYSRFWSYIDATTPIFDTQA